MFGLFKKRSLNDREIAERAESCLGNLLIQHGPSEFRKLVEVGYLGFRSNSVFYAADLSLIQDDTICYAKLSDCFSTSTTIKPAVQTASGWMVPRQIITASVLIAGTVKPWKGSGHQRIVSGATPQASAPPRNRVSQSSGRETDTSTSGSTATCSRCGGPTQGGVCWSCGRSS